MHIREVALPEFGDMASETLLRAVTREQGRGNMKRSLNMTNTHDYRHDQKEHVYDSGRGKLLAVRLQKCFPKNVSAFLDCSDGAVSRCLLSNQPPAPNHKYRSVY